MSKTLFRLILPLVAAMSSPAIAVPLNPSGMTSEAALKSEAAHVASASHAAIAQGSSSSPSLVSWLKEKVNDARAAVWGVQKQAAKAAEPGQKQASSNVVAAPKPDSNVNRLNSANSGSRIPASEAVIAQEQVPGLSHRASGVVSYDLRAAPAIPRIRLQRESKTAVVRYALADRLQKVMDDRVIHQFLSPEVLSREQIRKLSLIVSEQPRDAAKVSDPVFPYKGKVSRVALEQIVREQRPEIELKLKKFVPLTEEEMRFLSALLLFQQGGQCASAVGLFHKLSKSPGWQAESDYYLAMCSHKLGLETDFFERARRIFEIQDEHYSVLIMRELGNEIPYEFTDSLGFALSKVASNAKIMAKVDADVAGRVAYLLTEYGASTEKYKTVLEWAKKVPDTHPKKFQARFLEALAEYQTGAKERAAKLQEQLIHDTDGDKAQAEFQAMVALNLARMYFQDSRFKEAHENFMKVYKNHPLWLQSLMEFGWSQLQSGDFEGAIGNMYSIQSPFFASVYKPESYVIRTIGYMNLCQYGDAYKSLSLLEHDYRPDLEKMEKFVTAHQPTYQAVRDFIVAPSSLKEIDGLPSHVVREMARHRDFTNAQKAFNRQIDERPRYAALDGQVEKNLKAAQKQVTASRELIEGLRRKITSSARRPELTVARAEWAKQVQRESDALNDHFFQVDLFNEAKTAMSDYRKDVIGGADHRLVAMKDEMERILNNRLMRLKTDLARMLDNNELLRYEVFAGSGENLRFQVAGGEKGHRVPANVLPKSKSLQWSFEGEYWEDEIGNYRSSLKNNCPETQQSKQARVDGGGA